MGRSSSSRSLFCSDAELNPAVDSSPRPRVGSTMRMSFRWFGPTDPIPLAHVRQIPGVTGVVSALYDVPVGDAWPRDRLTQPAHAATDRALHPAGLRSSS